MQEFILTCRCGHEEGGCSEPQCIPLIEARVREHILRKHLPLLHSLSPSSQTEKIKSLVDQKFAELVTARRASMEEAYAP